MTTPATDHDANATPARRPRRNIALAVVFTLLALNAWAQAILAIAGRSRDPALLVMLQTLVGAAAAAAAVGCWKARSWAPGAALAYGVVGAILVASLGPLLDLAPEDRAGVVTGAIVVLLFGLWAAWYLRAGSPARHPTTGPS
ncbi:MAG TPA: hypothetical protein VGE02_05095 [Gemmatimonadales bacterium]